MSALYLRREHLQHQYHGRDCNHKPSQVKSYSRGNMKAARSVNHRGLPGGGGLCTLGTFDCNHDQRQDLRRLRPQGAVRVPGSMSHIRTRHDHLVGGLTTARAGMSSRILTANPMADSMGPTRTTSWSSRHGHLVGGLAACAGMSSRVLTANTIGDSAGQTRSAWAYTSK
jgi:hypothetical protein